MQKKKSRVLIVLTILLTAFVGVFYIWFVEKKIYEESTSHLNEIYGQINKDFQSLAEHNWKLLKDWSLYIRHIEEHGEEENLRKFINSGKLERKFSDFYFINENGEYVSVSGGKGYLEMGSQMETLMIDKQNVVVDGTLPNDTELTFFAVPVEQGEHAGFSYSAIAISYNNDNMEELLNVSAFDGQIECYVIYPDGRILFSTAPKENKPYNYLAMLEKKAVFGKNGFETVTGEIQDGHSGTVKYRMNHEEYYLTYMPVGFQDWMLLGNAPKKVVNASMSLIQRITIAIAAGIVILISSSILLYYHGINERKLRNMSAGIQFREQLFTMLVEHTAEIYAMFSAKDYRVGYISPNVERLLGIPAEDIRADIVALKRSHVKDIEIGWKEMDAMRPGESFQTERERNQVQTGERRWYREKLYRVCLEGEDKFIMVMTDCTDDKNLRSQLEEALQIAKAANQAKSNFLSNMSHDIRTPMNAILGFSLLLEKEADHPEKVREYTRKITASGNYLLGLINDILDMSKIEGGKTTLNIQQFKLTMIVEELNTIIQPLAKAKGQSFEIRIKDIREEKFMGDALRIKQIFLNLLSNAVKYTQEGGRIQLVISLTGYDKRGMAHLHFEVTDNGIGMSREYLEILFEPFTREAGEKIGEMQGTGLGMAITKNLVDLMGGTINVKSKKGEGTSFVIELALAVVSGKPAFPTEDQEGAMQSEHMEEVKEVSKDSERSLAGLKFLAAEDNLFNAEILQELLETEGAGCDIAENGQQVLEMFEASKPGQYQVILMDEQMPIMQGTKAAAAIRRSSHPQAKSIKIIALTANVFAEDVERSYAAGMDAHLFKPIDMEILKETVLRIL